MSSINQTIKLSGGLVYWNLQRFSEIFPLIINWTGTEAQEFIPNQMDPQAALKCAMQDRLVTRGEGLYPLKGNGFALVKENSKQDDVEFNTILTGQVGAVDGGLLTFKGRTRFLSIEERFTIEDEYVKMINRASNQRLAFSLVGLISKLKGVAMRHRGGMYWLHESKLEAWEKAVSVLPQAGSRNETYIIRHSVDTDSAKAILAAVTHEMDSQAQQLCTAIGSGKLGDRALASKTAEADAAIGKLEWYENLLGASLDKARENLKQVKVASAQGNLNGINLDLSFMEDM